MALEGGSDSVVEQTDGASSTTDVTKSDSQQQDGQKSASASGTQPDKNGEYEKQIAGFKADLIKERKARQQYEQDLRTERTAREADQKRIQALAGVTQQSPEESENEQIRQAFAQRFPELASLTKEDIEALRSLRNTQGSLEETTKHYWTQHGRQMVSGVVAEIEKELGGKLTERQARRIAAEYAREAESNEEFLDRHEKGDKTLITEFAKQLSEDWFEPARRKVTQQETQRYRTVPSGKDRGIVTHGEKKIDVNDPKAVEDLLVKGFRERGNEFGRR